MPTTTTAAQILAYAFAMTLWGLIGALLLTDRAVPFELYGAGAAAATAAAYLTRRPGDVSQDEAGYLAAEAYNEAAIEPAPRNV